MNHVLLSGTLVKIHESEDRRSRRLALEVYNLEIGDVVRCVAYGAQGLAAIPAGLQAGAQVQIVGRILSVHWRTKAGRAVREIGIEVQKVTIGEPGLAEIFAMGRVPSEIQEV